MKIFGRSFTTSGYNREAESRVPLQRGYFPSAGAASRQADSNQTPTTRVTPKQSSILFGTATDIICKSKLWIRRIQDKLCISYTRFNIIKNFLKVNEIKWLFVNNNKFKVHLFLPCVSFFIFGFSLFLYPSVYRIRTMEIELMNHRHQVNEPEIKKKKKLRSI